MSTNKVIFVDHCPVCIDGLARVRVCGIGKGDLHGFVMCDECDAVWRSPDLTADPSFIDPESGTCSFCDESVWSQHSRWANEEEVCLFGWHQDVTIDDLAQPTATDLAGNDLPSDEKGPGC